MIVKALNTREIQAFQAFVVVADSYLTYSLSDCQSDGLPSSSMKDYIAYICAGATCIWLASSQLSYTQSKCANYVISAATAALGMSSLFFCAQIAASTSFSLDHISQLF